jgi:hypothetical protein
MAGEIYLSVMCAKRVDSALVAKLRPGHVSVWIATLLKERGSLPKEARRDATLAQNRRRSMVGESI